jgi:hypothetical protein
MNECNCSVCNGKQINVIGIQISEKEIIPFLKIEVLKLRDPKHPFPMKYDGLLASCFALGQVLAYDREHKTKSVFYSESKWILKYSSELTKKFGIPILHKSELKSAHKFVCEFNVEDSK